MQKKDPDGYRKLLVYQKAQKLHDDVLELITHFPPVLYKQTHYKDCSVKTVGDLVDQMPRSARSTHKNIVEGWKRETTQEYFDFLSFSIGSNGELKDDAADIACGKYKELMGIKGVMGEKGTAVTPLTPSSPYTLSQLDSFKFYPLDESLPPIVKIYLKAKEVDYLLKRLKESLDVKMDNDHTKPQSQMLRENREKDKQNDAWFEQYTKDMGLVRLENGQYVTKEEWEQLQKGKKGDKEE